MREAIALVSVVIIMFVLGIYLDTYHAAQAAAEETPACTAIAHIGAQNVWRCDDEETGARCYMNTTGMMFCLE